MQPNWKQFIISETLQNMMKEITAGVWHESRQPKKVFLISRAAKEPLSIDKSLT